MRILVVDVGGSHVKVLATGHQTPIKIPSGPDMTPAAMVMDVRAATRAWRYEAVSIGYPGAVLHGRPLAEPRNLGAGRVGFNFRKAFGRMLFLGLGTGLGSAMIIDGVLEPMELAHPPKVNDVVVGGYRLWKAHVRR